LQKKRIFPKVKEPRRFRMVIQQTIEIPANHRLTIDVPQEVPAGKATITYSPEPKSGQAVPAGRGKIPDDLLPFVQEAARRAERERTDPAYRAEIAEIRRKCQEGGPIFGGMDGMEYQRSMRDEWPD
jgi:hypothetical protein